MASGSRGRALPPKVGYSTTSLRTNDRPSAPLGAIFLSTNAQCAARLCRVQLPSYASILWHYLWRFLAFGASNDPERHISFGASTGHASSMAADARAGSFRGLRKSTRPVSSPGASCHYSTAFLLRP